MCSFSGHFGGWTTFFHMFISLASHCALGLCIGRWINWYVKGISFHIKEFSFKWFWPKIYYLLYFNMLFNFSFYFCSLLFNMFFLLIIINYNDFSARGEKCLWKPHNVSSSLSPIVLARCKTSKNLFLCVSFLSKTLIIFSKYRKRPWHKWFNINHLGCFKHLFSIFLQFFFLFFFIIYLSFKL